MKVAWPPDRRPPASNLTIVHRGPPGGGTWTGVAVTVGGILLGIAVALAIPSLRGAVSDAIHGDTAAVRQDLNGNAAGALLVVWLAMVHVIVWYPAEILDAASGYVFGFGVGFPLVLASWTLSGLASYSIGRHFARPVLYRIAGEERFVRTEQVIHRGGVLALLAVRLIPIMPFSLMGYVCGAARIPLWRFTWTTHGRLRADHRLLHLRRQQAPGLLRRGSDPLDRRGRAHPLHLRRALPPAPRRSGLGRGQVTAG